MSSSPPSSIGNGDSFSEASGVNDDRSSEKEQMREAADGGPTDGAMSESGDSDNTATKNNSGSKEQQNDSRDLDKDIDAMLEHSARNEQVDPDGSANNQCSKSEVTIDPNVDKSGNVESSLLVGIPVDVSSEKSFTSDCSSVLAESVVKRVIGNAIEVLQADGIVDEKIDKSSKENIPVVKPGDVKVGLFQYQDDNSAENECDDNDDEEEDENDGSEINLNDNSSREETKPKEPMVGLFQYTNMNDIERSKSPDSSEAVEENLESLNEEEKENIFQLYGLEGIDPVSPKSASPDESGPDSMEDKDSGKVVDVQREIYEPSARLFSVTRDTSSSESTPRLESDTNIQLDEKSSDTTSNQADHGNENELGKDDENNAVFNEQNVISEKEVFNQDSDTGNDEKSNEAEDNLPEPETKVAQSVSPPLIQYESVKENGKFRIIKTSKEGISVGYPGIRVGGDISSPKESPRSTESPKESPRESPRESNAESDQKSEPRKESPREVIEDVLEDQTPRLKTADLLRKSELLVQNNETKADGGGAMDANSRDEDASLELDREKIRKLLEKESEADPRMLMRDGQSSQDSGLPRSLHSARPDESDQKSPRQMSLSELQTSTSRDKDLSMDSGLSRIKYTTRDTTGREVKRTGPKPYDVHEERDKFTSDSKFFDTSDRPIYGRESHESSRASSSYENDLLRSAYDRVSHHKPNKQESLSTRSQESSIIPGFKTLQDQQAKWSDMFNTLETEHRRELRSQYDRHQYNIQRLQQQMELELQKQHLAIRKKLDIHKEALAKMSPDRDGSQRYRSPDRSVSPNQRSPGRSRAERSGTDQSTAEDLAALQSSFDSKTWREIYREVREEEERSPSPPRPLKRSLDNDFASMDSTLDRSRPTGRRSSPRGSSDLSRSGSRERSREVTMDSSQRTPTNVKLTKGDRDRSINSSRSPRSRVKDRHVSPEGRDSRSPHQSADGRPEGVSRHVKELLDNLSDTRHGLRGLEDDLSTDRPLTHGEAVSERPRAGVYSSPMPFLSRSRFSQSTDRPVDSTLTDESSRLTQSLPLSRGDRAEFYDERPRTSGGRDHTYDSSRFDDSCLSPSTRMNLREKHSKHLADLRAYYEDELRELRKALSDSLDASAISADMSAISPGQNQMIDAENKRLMDKCRALEDENEELILKLRTLEQKNHGLEKRASEYASAFTDTQAMSIQHRAHIEELQRYCRERDDLINELESKKVSNEDSVKIYKKNLEEEMELHRQDKIALQRMMDRYDSLDREYKLLQETMNTTENKLYETRTEIVELNRAMSKYELENKRLGRENDNLRHKVTQSLNLSALHESFGSPPSPREVQNVPESRSLASAGKNVPETNNRPGTMDQRVPGFSTSMMDWSTSSQTARPKSADVNKSRNDVSQSSRMSGVTKEKKESRSRKKESKESDKGRQSEKSSSIRIMKDNSSVSSSREDVSNRPQNRLRDVDETPTRERTTQRERSPQKREITPTRSMSPSSQAESEVSDYSPLLKAERELFKLRDMMRQAVAVKPSLSPPQPKLQKKFYGSERPANKDDYTPDLSIPRGRKEKPSISSHSSVAKTKSSQTPSKSERTSEKSSSKRTGSSKSEKSSKSREHREVKDGERREKGRERVVDKDTSQQGDTDRQFARNEDLDTPTRFDININEEKKTVNVTPRKSENQSGKLKNLFNGDADNGVHQERRVAAKGSNSDANGQVENTLDMMRGGQFITRPEWENVYTSLAKQKTESQDRTRNLEEKVKDRIKQISEMESRYDGLQAEKRQLESSINKIPLHGRVDRNNRRHKEELEDRLDDVEKELGSLRMSLKRYNVLKTTG